MGKLIKNSMSSWKTTALGIIGALIVVLPELQAMIDSDPATVGSWDKIIGAVTVALGLTVARDGDKSSEDVGVK